MSNLCKLFKSYLGHQNYQNDHRPDMTFAVDWALKTNYLSIYPKLSKLLACQTVMRQHTIRLYAIRLIVSRLPSLSTRRNLLVLFSPSSAAPVPLSGAATLSCVPHSRPVTLCGAGSEALPWSPPVRSEIAAADPATEHVWQSG